LLGEPYLKDLQAFAINCPVRAQYVVPTQPPGTGGTNRRGPLARHSSVPTMPAASVEYSAAQEPQATRPRLRPTSAEDLGIQEQGAVPLSLDSDDDVLDASKADPLVAKLWEKLPENGGSRTSTRPPSAADGSRPSSYPTSVNSRNSSRPMSRLWSAKSQHSRPPSGISRALHATSPMRPSSSPLVRSSSSDYERAAMQRPSSVPPAKAQSAARLHSASS